MKESILEQAQDMATDTNLYGKRLRERQLELCENFASSIDFEYEAPEILKLLLANKPVKATKTAASTKLAHDHVQGSHTGLNAVRHLSNDCYILTSVQNNTAINKDFLAALETYAEHKNADLLISGFTYNKTGYQLDRDNKPFFDASVKPYLVNEPLQLFEGLIFAAELDIIPTATNPVNGHHDYFGDSSLIVPHAKIALLSQATGVRENTRFIYSTGCLSLKNYRQQRAGQRAEQSHCISALIAEKADTATGWQVRQLHWVTDNFIDLDHQVTSEFVLDAPAAAAITLGDLHSEKMNWDNLGQACELIAHLEPENVFLHDSLDFSTRNSHRRRDHLFVASQDGESVKDDLGKAGDVLGELAHTLPTAQFWCVRSNHDEQIERWLTDRQYNFMDDIQENARLYLDLQSLAYSYIEKGEKVPDLFKLALLACDEEIPDNLNFLTRNCVKKIQGVLCSSHGDQGSSGARGSLMGLSKLYAGGATIGHSHSCGIQGSVFQTGCMNLYQGYNEGSGLSAWSISHVIQYANGSRTVITY